MVPVDHDPFAAPQSTISKVLEPFTSYPAELAEKSTAAYNMMKEGAAKGAPSNSPLTQAAGALQTGLGGLGYVTSPITAAVTSLIGKPVERMTSGINSYVRGEPSPGIPHDLTDFATELAIPGMGLKELQSWNLVRLQHLPDTLGAFERTGVTPTLPSVVQNRGVSAASKYLGDTLVGGPISNATKTQFGQAANQAENIAGNISDVGEKSLAGERLQAGAQNFVKNVAPSKQDELYGQASALIDPRATSMLPQTFSAIGRINRMISDPAVRAFVTDKNFTKLQDTLYKSAANGGLTFDDLRQIRSQVRQLRPAEGSAVGVNKVAVNSIYDGLTQDMKNLAFGAGGPDALHAITRADQYTRALAATRTPAIQKIIDAKSGEDAFNTVTRMAGSNSAADWRRLMQVKQSVSPQDWNDLSATVIRHLGEPTAGSKTVGDAGFSPVSFMTKFSGLSDRGKDILFGGQSAPLRKSLDDLATVAGNLKRVEGLGNPSGTTRAGTVGATLVGLSNPVTFFPVLKALGTGAVAARILSSPKLVSGLAAIARARQANNKMALAFQMRRLPTLAAGDTEAVDAISKAVMGGASPVHAGEDQNQ